MKAILLNSGMGTRLEELTKNIPKSMIKIDKNETIFSKAINTLKTYEIDEYIITTGYLNNVLENYAKKSFPEINFTFVHNPIYDSTNYIKSIDFIDDNIEEDILLLHGDLIFDKEVIEKLFSTDKSAMVVDSSIDIPEKDFKAKMQNGFIKKISVNYFENDAIACQPLYKLKNNDWIEWKNNIRIFCQNNNTTVYAEESLNELLTEKINLKAIDIKGYYCSEIDNKEDLKSYKETIGETND